MNLFGETPDSDLGSHPNSISTFQPVTEAMLPEHLAGDGVARLSNWGFLVILGKPPCGMFENVEHS